MTVGCEEQLCFLSLTLMAFLHVQTCWNRPVYSNPKAKRLNETHLSLCVLKYTAFFFIWLYREE